MRRPLVTKYGGVPPLTEHMQSGGPAVPVHASGRGTGEGRHPRRGRQGGLGAASAAWAQHQGEAGAQDGGGVDSGQSRATPRAGACRFWGRCWEVRAELCSPRSPRRGRAGRVAERWGGQWAGRRALPTMAAASQSGGGLGVEVKVDGGQRRSRSPSGAVGRLVAAHRGGTPCRTRSPNTVVHMEHSAAHGGSRRQ